MQDQVQCILLYLFVPFHPQQKFKLPHGGVVVFILCVSVFYFVCEMNECLYVGNTSAQVNKSQVVPSFKVLVSDIFSRYDDINFYCIIYLLNEIFSTFICKYMILIALFKCITINIVF